MGSSLTVTPAADMPRKVAKRSVASARVCCVSFLGHGVVRPRCAAKAETPSSDDAVANDAVKWFSR